jgi:hypothetical protein
MRTRSSLSKWTSISLMCGHEIKTRSSSWYVRLVSRKPQKSQIYQAYVPGTPCKKQTEDTLVTATHHEKDSLKFCMLRDTSSTQHAGRCQYAVRRASKTFHMQIQCPAPPWRKTSSKNFAQFRDMRLKNSASHYMYLHSVSHPLQKRIMQEIHGKTPRLPDQKIPRHNCIVSAALLLPQVSLLARAVLPPY